MGCSSCRKKREARKGLFTGSKKPKTSTSTKTTKPSPTQTTPDGGSKTTKTTSNEWRGGNPFSRDSLSADLSDDDEEALGFDDEEDHDDSEIQWVHLPEDCPECDESYQEFEREITSMKVDLAKPAIEAMEEIRREALEKAQEMSKKIDALKLYLNGIDVDGVDITDITSVIEEDINLFINSIEGNTPKSAPFKD